MHVPEPAKILQNNFKHHTNFLLLPQLIQFPFMSNKPAKIQFDFETNQRSDDRLKINEGSP